jgi:late competence protein required for DNA uptake (superfamily II DNA/RNA helicase)
MDETLEQLPIVPASIKGKKCQRCGATDYQSYNISFSDFSTTECDRCPWIGRVTRRVIARVREVLPPRKGGK